MRTLSVLLSINYVLINSVIITKIAILVYTLGKASTASHCHLHICKNYACRWRKFKDILDCGRHRLDVSTCQEYRRRWVSAASPSTCPQCGTVPSALRDSSLSLNTFKRRLKTHLFGQS